MRPFVLILVAVAAFFALAILRQKRWPLYASGCTQHPTGRRRYRTCRLCASSAVASRPIDGRTGFDHQHSPHRVHGKPERPRNAELQHLPFHRLNAIAP